MRPPAPIAPGFLHRLRGAARNLFAATHPPPAPARTTAYLGDHTALTLLEDRLMMFVDTRGNDIAPHLLMRGQWEPNYTRLFESLIRPGDTVLDLGANLGVYALLAAGATGPTGRVHAFEPNPRYAALLQRSIAVNGFSGFAKVHAVAVGEADGEAELQFSWAWGGGGQLIVDPDHLMPEAMAHRCRLVALDTLFEDPDFTVDVLKMDVEGAEGRALRGMWRLLERSPDPRLLFEYAPGLMAWQGVEAGEAINLLSGLGFNFWSVAANSTLAPISVDQLEAIAGGVQNILAARGEPLRSRP